jgi:UDPglucose--hexose-1-phosphate uridylyltransferase
VPELRKDPIVGRWVIISSDRARRPSDFIQTHVTNKGGFCPFCPGNESKTPPEIMAYRSQVGSAPVRKDSPGWRVRVVPNKYPALGIEGTLDRHGEGMYDGMNGIGAHEVIIESPEHNASTATLTERQIEEYLWAFRDRIIDLKRDHRLKYILIFKNHGEQAGASLEHPHAQLIALPIVPKHAVEEMEGSRQYYIIKERCIYCDIARQEMESPARLIAEDDEIVTIAPYAPRFPFESWILPKRHESCFEDTSSKVIASLARSLKQLLMRAEVVLDHPAYNIVLHTTPIQDGANEFYHWHLEFMPKLTKTAGFEWGTGFYINPTPPEEAARFLREADLSLFNPSGR